MYKFPIAIALLASGYFLTLSAADSTAEPFEEGVQYARLATPQPTGDSSKIEVIELFWYGCSHCFQLEPHVNEWLGKKPEDVDFVRIPAIPTQRWDWYAKLFYTALYLDVLEKIHTPLFKEIHEKQNKIKTEDDAARFFATHGVAKEDFMKTLKSFAVVTKVNQAKQLTRRYGVDAVPTLVVNGKYRVTARMAGDGDTLFEVVDYLAQQERPGLKSVAEANP